MRLIPPPERGFPAEVPLAIVGAGAAGLVAALAAREAGLEPLLLERDAVPGGSTALSAGLIPAAGTRWQAAAGVADDPARLAADVQRKAGGEADPVLLEALCREAGPALEWLADAHGLAFSLITDFLYPGHSAHRMHGLPSRSGAELMDRLRSAAERAGIAIVTEAVVTALHAEGDRVLGLEVTRPDGRAESLGLGLLLLACNGYGGNPDLVARHLPEMAGALYFGHAGNRGDALLWGEALGAATRHLSGHQGHGSVAHPAGILITWASVAEGGVQVDAAGRRFHDESRGYSEAAAEVLRREGGIAWTVFDERIAAVCRQFEDYRSAEAAGAVLAADTLAGLAATARLPAGALEATLAATRAGPDPLGRDFSAVPPLSSPYRAVRVTGALFHTQGGLVVDGRGRVLRPDGSPLPNLLAAGGAACGVSGPRASGYLSGNGLLSAVVLGRLAGRAAAALHHP